MLNPKLKRWILIDTGILLLAGFIAFCAFFYSYYESAGPLDTKKIVFIHKGNGLSTISHQLFQEGIIEYPLLFEAHLRIRQISHHVRAGEFEFQPHQSPAEVYHALASGPFVQHVITIPEGTKSKDVVKLLSEAALIEQDVKLSIAEGDLLPETYNYTWNEPVSAIVERMKNSMKTALDKLWTEHKRGHQLHKPEDVLILASIVEKETSLASERPHVAAVFLNRLRIGMPLQSDPTVFYGLEVDHNRPGVQLSKADLHAPSRYNTYLNKGLPPTPICNPGKASIEAVMQPLDTKDLYFVADGKGGHVFAETYEEHMLNHQKWRKIRDAKEAE
jgi:UPF0755 protein